MSERKNPFVVPVVFTIIVGGCGLAFMTKLYRFIGTLYEGGPDALGFALVPVMNYLTVAAGFVMLLVWAFLNGQFVDIERAKYEMLENEARYDREDPLWQDLQRQRTEG
jgi:hypothetical protein